MNPVIRNATDPLVGARVNLTSALHVSHVAPEEDVTEHLHESARYMGQIRRAQIALEDQLASTRQFNRLLLFLLTNMPHYQKPPCPTPNGGGFHSGRKRPDFDDTEEQIEAAMLDDTVKSYCLSILGNDNVHPGYMDDDEVEEYEMSTHYAGVETLNKPVTCREFYRLTGFLPDWRHHHPTFDPCDPDS